MSINDKKKLLDEKGMDSHLNDPKWGPSFGGDKVSNAASQVNFIFRTMVE